MSLRVLKGMAAGILLLVAAGCGGTCRPTGDETEEFVDTQIRNLSSPDWTVRRCAATALGIVGPKAGKAVCSLTYALDDVQPCVSCAAREALAKIQPDPAPLASATRLDRSRHD
jgi:HEAT repeat protein